MTSSTIFVILIFVLSLTIADAKNDVVPVTYLSYVDNAYGFYRVIDLTTHKPSSYDNRTLIINQGDTVTWMNDADNVIFAVASEQKLFEDKRLNVRQRSSYTFDQIGTYTFYIKGYVGRSQTIIVNAMEGDISPTPVMTPITTPIVTPIPTTNTPTPVITTNPPPPRDPPSMTQIVSVIVALLSIFITYSVGKDKDESKGEYKEIGKRIKDEEKFSYNIGYSEKISGALCYLSGFLTGILFIIIARKENKFVRFHALQSIITFWSLFVILLIFMEIPSIGDVFGPLLVIIGPILWLLLMIKAYQGKIYKLPIIGNIAERYC